MFLRLLVCLLNNQRFFFHFLFSENLAVLVLFGRDPPRSKYRSWKQTCDVTMTSADTTGV